MTVLSTNIPTAKSVFNTEKTPKSPVIVTDIVRAWLNSEVLEEIEDAEPETSARPITIKGSVAIKCPDSYYAHRKEFEEHVIDTLTNLGYKVEFADDGCGQYQVCYITWKA
jgi:hypothetical protein